VGQFPCGSFQHCYLPALHVARQSSLLRSRYKRTWYGTLVVSKTVSKLTVTN
jgi:hypothetical protein